MNDVEISKYIKEHAKLQPNGKKYTVGVEDYLHCMKEQGVDRKTIDQFFSAHNNVTRGAYRFTSEVLEEKCQQLMKDGKEEEARKTEFTTSINVPKGTTEVYIKGAKKGRDPQRGCTMWTPARASVKITQYESFDKDYTNEFESKMRELLKLDELNEQAKKDVGNDESSDESSNED